MICIVGADGFFGTYMQKHILSKASHPFLLCLNHSEAAFSEADNKADMSFELGDPQSIKRAADIIGRHSDIRILYLASVHNPDTVKKDPERALYMNTVCYENFLSEIKGADISKLIYASSDTVYGESIDGYSFSENDKPCPINIYGEQKLLAERITEKFGFTNARYSYMCGNSLTVRKKHFFDEITEKLKSNEQIFMLTDWIRSSITYRQASEITYKLLMSETDEKTVNICADMPTSKYDIGLKAAENIGASSSLVVPCTMKELGIFTEKRANTLITDNTLIKKICNIESISLAF